MSNRFVIADMHFGHAGILNVPGRKEVCGNMTIEQHDEWLVENWNEVVTKRDTVYLLGDVGMDQPQGYVTLGIIPRLKGTINVVGGNHDTPEILQHFNKVNGVMVVKVEGYRCILTHIPIHPQEMYWDYNIHGHLHNNFIKKDATTKDMGKLNLPADDRYICVSCEHTGYKPMPIEDAVTRSGRTEPPMKRKYR